MNGNSGGSWHPLWTSASSTWQTNHSPFNNSQQKRSRSISATTLHGTADDYFQFNKGDYDKSLFPTPQLGSSSIWFFERRHSIATVNQQQQQQQALVRPITPPPQSQQQQQQQAVSHLIQQLQQQQQQIDEYFRPTTAVVDVQCLGKGIPVHQLKDDRTLVYQIQFKCHYKYDYFYVQPEDTMMQVELKDMMIVEADRGYDLGQVVQVLPLSSLPDHVHSLKRIFRHANPAELSTHELKRQDEEKALIICQAKIKQKNLNMEVVDAEYQWDRRKLTFYFKANERIDFRELVRELFKIYKTRIWMCAYSSSSLMDKNLNIDA
ncbi:MAG: PSP1 C-terminal conserved region-domain-containing protein [Benjaminiella poitrasii]|nr:MAG: PSP1 C-terminal conserved region-domain-containing protein [Benjaminiella poitrasii]